MPVTVARKFPAEELWQASPLVPEPPVIVVCVRVQTRLVELVVKARVTVPVKPFRGATVMVDVVLAPTFSEMLVGFADNEKSAAALAWKVTVAECERLLLVPVTVAR